MPEWITPVVTVVAIFISFILGSIQSRSSYDKKQKQLRYDEFYVPYFKSLYLAIGYFGDFCSFSDEDKQRISAITEEQIQHLGEKSQKLFLDFYNIKVQYAATNYMSINRKELEHKLDVAFRNFTKAVMKETKSLSKELHLPEISHTFELQIEKLMELCDTTAEE